MYHLAKDHIKIRASNEIIVSRVVSSLGLAMASSVQSIYLKSMGMTDSSIGFILAITSIAVMLSSPLLPGVMEKYRLSNVYTSSVLLLGLSYLCFSLVKTPPLAVLIIIVSGILSALIINSASVLFRDSSSSFKNFTKYQGLLSSLNNFAWTIGPLLGGFILSGSGLDYVWVFSGGSVIMAAMFLKIMPLKIPLKHRETIDSDWRANIYFYFSHKKLVLAYVQNLGTGIWWTMVWTFMPLFLIEHGYSGSDIGIFLAATQLPPFFARV